MTALTDRSVAIDQIVRALRDEELLERVVGTLPARISAITDDSRQVRAGGAFIAVRGSERDGHDFLDAAAHAGAAVALVEDDARTTLPSLVVREGRRAAAVAASAFHDFPARSLSMVGVTGTSGKTTTASMLRHLLDGPGAAAASLGTLGVLVGSEGRTLPGGAGLTTPGPVELQRVLRLLVESGVRTVAMEVSSHALDQERVEGLRFAAATFSNLSRDHLDYHGTMEAYFTAKARLVDLVAPDGVVVINDDVETWRALPSSRRIVRYGLESRSAEVRARDVQLSPSGSRWTLETPDGSASVSLPLIGDFNISNALGSAAVAWALGHSPTQVAERLSTLPQVPGRLERILEQPVVLRDYAHKPDALQRALVAVRPFSVGRLILVVGCGGDRDRGKRPIMGAIAERLADTVILTSDNPRTENPERILDEIESGMHDAHERIEDRRTAIARALALATEDDVVVLAGKGHETYQIRGTTSYPFDEKAIVHELAATSVRGRP
ncbi:MAG: UDP-N-acetylmuramoyl-L-alanyl-D-glutamate--2,6-diaminopimelate ligase [Gemmatimonadota bacterium]